jgi:hypothetical protein
MFTIKRFTIKSNLTGLVIAAGLCVASLFLLSDPSVAAEPNQASSQQEDIGSASLSNRG